MPHVRRWVAGLLLSALVPSWSPAQTAPDPLAALESTTAAAEAALREGELQIAESRYRSALMMGWLLVGGLDGAEGRVGDARRAFERASVATVQPREALQTLALVHLLEGDPAMAINILTKLVARAPKDVTSRRLLAQALASAGQTGEAVQELEEAHAIAPDDPELQFALASGYLRVKKPDEAAGLFAQIAKARPIAPTWVLIGRTYRDAGQYVRARDALRRAITMDPKVRRAHYYLGTVALLEEGIVRLDEAIREFQQELALAPGDPIATLRLGMALVLAQRPAEALPYLEQAVAFEPPIADAWHYRGRALLALDRPADAAVSLQRALDLSGGKPRTETQLGTVRNIHYQLGQALRASGNPQEATAHFEAAERASGRVADVARDDLAKYLADAPDPEAVNARPPLDVVFPYVSLPVNRRAELKRGATMALVRAYFNLGVMHVQAQRFARGAESFEQAAALDPRFPQVQFSLGVAHFNAQQYQKAVPALEQAVADRPDAADVRRMLSLAYLNAGVYAKAAELLRNDPGRDSDPSLQYAFGVALARSNRPQDAGIVFSQLLEQYPDMPEANVALGQANAAEGDYDQAVQHFQKAIAAKPDVAEAHAALGYIYLTQGRLDEAGAELRAELASHPSDQKARHTLATVLDLQGKPDEALTLLRTVLRAQPEFADARYLLGKILLAQGAAEDAVVHLEAAARLAPDDANIHYQLGQAYQRLGQTERAQQEFETFRVLKDKRDGRVK